DGRAAQRAAADAGHRRRLRAPAAARHHDGRRAAAQPGADAVHDPGDLPGVRPAGGEGTAMSFSETFIRRPVATTLITLGIVLSGMAAFRLLPVAPLPQIEYPTISVSASLPGASPE